MLDKYIPHRKNIGNTLFSLKYFLSSSFLHNSFTADNKRLNALVDVAEICSLTLLAQQVFNQHLVESDVRSLIGNVPRCAECINSCLKSLLPFVLSQLYLFEPVHEISNNVVCATSKASDQPAHTRSLIRAFASRLSIL